MTKVLPSSVTHHRIDDPVPNQKKHKLPDFSTQFLLIGAAFLLGDLALQLLPSLMLPNAPRPPDWFSHVNPSGTQRGWGLRMDPLRGPFSRSVDVMDRGLLGPTGKLHENPSAEGDKVD